MMNADNFMFMNISILYRCGQKYYDKRLSNYQIGAGQILFLILIYENEGINLQELATYGCFDKGTVTKGMQKLEEQGFIKSTQDESDRRIRRLYTSDKTKDIISQIYMIRREWWERLCKDMDSEELLQLETSLEKLCANARLYEEEDDQEIKLFGLQKLSLLDYPGKVGSTVFTGGCNFRCPFCHNADLVFLPENTAEIKESDIMEFLKKRQGILEGVCISGGEPLLNGKLEGFLRNIRALGYTIKLDTNGSQPDKLKYLIDEGLVDYVAMDIKNSMARYAETIDVQDFDITSITKSVSYLLTRPVPYEFRTTIVKEFHSAQDIVEIAQWIQGADAYYLQNFENSEHVIQKGLHPVTKDEMQHFAKLATPYVKNTNIRGLS